MKIGEKIKLLRTQSNITQKELSTRLNVSSQAVSNWERHKGYPDIGNIIRLSELFNISLDELIKKDSDFKTKLLESRVTNSIESILGVIGLIVFIGIFYFNIHKFISSNFSDLSIMGLVVGFLGIIYFGKEIKKRD